MAESKPTARHFQSTPNKNRGRGRGDSRGKRRDMGRSEWSKMKLDKRQRNDDEQAAKRQRIERGDDALPVYATEFSKDDIAAEERRPKKKVAVLIGYSGTGYRGMQLAHDQKTIEGDLFKAFVAAGAISKANATDPKKSSFVRCARTDKGVHAAGNLISLKLIVEDENIVQKINQNLGPRIRVWGYERTNNSFSAYQMCDSRIYEYLIPTYSFLPPHPSSYMGRKIAASAKEMNDEEGLRSRQQEVSGFWDTVDAEIETILARHDDETRKFLEEALYFKSDSQARAAASSTEPRETPVTEPESTSKENEDKYATGQEASTAETRNETVIKSETSSAEFKDEPLMKPETISRKVKDEPLMKPETSSTEVKDEPVIKPETGSTKSEEEPAIKLEAGSKEAEEKPIIKLEASQTNQDAGKPTSSAATDAQEDSKSEQKKVSPPAEYMKELRAVYLAAKRSYRISEARLERIQACLSLYEGTQNYHNFTVDKSCSDPSASRLIKSFVVNPTPILIDGTEWLSLKVHGQSFMMHQIRKMVAMVALVVRAGCDPKRITEAFGADPISIPKAPSLGLLLERPVFDNYNKRAKNDYAKENLDFDKYETELNAFKQKEIYERIYHDEQTMSLFSSFFNHVDNFANEAFLFVTSKGIPAAKNTDGQGQKKKKQVDAGLESDQDEPKVRNGEGEEG